MAYSNTTTLDSAFKEQYLKRPISDLTIPDRPLTALMPKKTDWKGANLSTRALEIPLKYARPGAISNGAGGFTVAQTAAANSHSQITRWSLTSRQTYGFLNIDNESMMRSEGQEAAFAELKALEIDGIFEAIANRLEIYAFGDGSAVIGVVGNTIQQPNFSGSTLTLADPETAMNFENGDQLTFAPTNFGTERTGSFYVGNLDRDAGTLQSVDVNGNPVVLSTAVTGIANGDTITHKGARGLAQTGLAFYNPAVAPVAGDNAYGVDRSKDPQRLAGSRHNGLNQAPLEAVLRGAEKVARASGKIEQGFTSFKHNVDMVMDLSAKGILDYITLRPKTNPQFGFEGVHVQGTKGSFDLIPSWAAPSGTCFLTKLSDWMLISVGDTVRTLNSDGLQFLRLSTTDGVEVRIGSYSNFVNIDPRSACNVSLAS